MRKANWAVDACDTHAPNKFVLLTHDQHFEDVYAAEHLDELIQLFLLDGWLFRRLDTFANDDPYDTSTLQN